MKKVFTFIIVCSLLTIAPPSSAATPEKVYTVAQMAGNLLVEKNTDRIWYVEPIKKVRYIIRDDTDVAWLRDNLTIAVATKDFEAIPRADTTSSIKYTGKFKGRMISAVPDPNDSWYVSPANGRKYLLDGYSTVEKLAADTGIVVGNKSLAKVTMTKKQVMFDPTFLPLSYVRFDGEKFVGGRYAKTVMPLASLTKLMTALVVLDSGLDFEKQVVVTADQIKYPKVMVGDDATSEVPLKAGDTVAIKDLWASLLLASSNQSAVILADATGLSRSEFVRRMNEKAAAYKLTRTRFSEMAGLSPNNVSTPEEMAILAHRAFGKYQIAEPSVRTKHSFTVIGADGTPRSIDATNRNYSLLAFDPRGAKTGYLTEAQRNVALKKDGQIVVVMHAASMNQRNNVIKQLLP